MCSPFLYSTTATSIMSATIDTIMTAEIDPINIALLFISESPVKSMGSVSTKLMKIILLLHNAVQLITIGFIIGMLYCIPQYYVEILARRKIVSSVNCDLGEKLMYLQFRPIIASSGLEKTYFHIILYYGGMTN